ncbi:MAG TPA: pilus assembly protein CpaF [Porticoccaceae bacterium]|nr:pilus assembly protein CpaF [Porticoccaceae bacterium]
MSVYPATTTCQKDDNPIDLSSRSVNKRLRRLLQDRLIDLIDDDGIDTLRHPSDIKARLHDIVATLSPHIGQQLSAPDMDQITTDIIAEISGYGPITCLFEDKSITDILINGPSDIWADKRGSLQKTDIEFDDEEHLRRFIDRLLGAQGKQLDASRPMVDARLPDGSRIHTVIPPLSPKGPVVSIRRFHRDQITANTLVDSNFLSREMLRFLELLTVSGANIVIAGNSGAGKTSLLNVLSGYIPAHERIVTIEEIEELKLNHHHVVPLVSRDGNSEDRGAFSLRDLVKTALRMRADRIIIGEVRGAEVLDMLQAMNVGHEGSLTTLHANAPKEVLNRIETLALIGDTNLNRDIVRHMMTSAIQVIVQVRRFADGSRRITSICDIDNRFDPPKVNELFTFLPSSGQAGHDGGGRFLSSGNDCSITHQLAEKGCDVTELCALLKDSNHEQQ